MPACAAPAHSVTFTLIQNIPTYIYIYVYINIYIYTYICIYIYICIERERERERERESRFFMCRVAFGRATRAHSVTFAFIRNFDFHAHTEFQMW